MRALLLSQGVYYVATGVWPLVDIETFQRMTGPKTDKWLVKTVGALITVVGLSLLAASRREAPSEEAVVLSAGSAAALAVVDVIFAAKGRVSPVYLLDALPEAAIAAAWLGRTAHRKQPSARRAEPGFTAPPPR